MTHTGAFSVQRTSQEVFDRLSDPARFAPLMPDFESMSMQDAAHFTMRTVFAIGEIKGHANLAMELRQASFPERISYAGSATIAGSQLRLAIDFQINSQAELTEVTWRGEVTLDGTLALMAGTLVDSMGRQNFDRMAENLQLSLQEEAAAPDGEPAPEVSAADLNFEI